VGANPGAARYAGLSVTRNFVLAMLLSGALAGLAGTSQVLGVDCSVGQTFTAGCGFLGRKLEPEPAAGAARYGIQDPFWNCLKTLYLAGD
jgi:predicted ABC-type sugar transport system permease subunit